jgi:hypothetical protein
VAIESATCRMRVRSRCGTVRVVAARRGARNLAREDRAGGHGGDNKVTPDEQLSEGAPLGPAVTHVAVLTIFYVLDRTVCATVTRDSD